MDGHFGHQRGRGHAGLGVDLQPDKLAILGEAVVVAEVGTADATAPDRLMRLERECLYFLLNIR